MIPPYFYSSKPIDEYPRDRIPYEAFNQFHSKKKSSFDEFVDHIENHRNLHNKPTINIRQHLVNHMKKHHNMNEIQAGDFWGDLWDGIKSGVTNIWNSITGDPIGTLKTVSSAIAPLL